MVLAAYSDLRGQLLRSAIGSPGRADVNGYASAGNQFVTRFIFSPFIVRERSPQISEALDREPRSCARSAYPALPSIVLWHPRDRADHGPEPRIRGASAARETLAEAAWVATLADVRILPCLEFAAITYRTIRDRSRQPRNR